MEHEIEGMLELDGLELSAASSQQPPFPAELAILEDAAAPLSADRCDVSRSRAERVADQR